MTKQSSSTIKLDQVYCESCTDVSFVARLPKFNFIYADVLYDDVSAIPIASFVRTLVPGGILAVQSDYRTIAKIKNRLDRFVDYSIVGSSIEFINWIIWPYDWGGRAKDRFAAKHDDILIYRKKGDEHTFNVGAIEIKKTVMMRSTKTYKIPTDVWSDIGNFYTTSKERIKVNGHNAKWQKPEALFRRLILAFTNEGDVVYEPYLGTGTACVVANQYNRRYVGCDTDPLFVKVAKMRLHATRAGSYQTESDYTKLNAKLGSISEQTDRRSRKQT